ncbi:TetR/AcrR family transcriptional regulator [Chengkuizengella marina]|uniref:TetR/AcrR family transcriptional regulator n=1 Tax=Chengkuizengella marina TaxID=2507566 RepID=A0A6N9Q1P9_9BACL|nr:TetR/AcrR family transcriptional regulator [Chengkuizengella marina]NBI28180.1 TetR/AcrR family transcriptional regulator [Chengkuizengella marina]
MTKNKILKESLGLFANKGYYETSMEDIASAVGIKKASLYSHYAGKEDIFSAVYNKILVDNSAFIKELTTFNKDIQSQDKLKFIFNRYVKNCKDNVQMEFWDRYYYYPPEYLKDYIHEKTEETEKGMMKEIEKIVEEGIKKQEFIQKDASDVALSFYYMMIGFAMSVKFYTNKEIEKDLTSCLNVFLGGIGKK